MSDSDQIPDVEALKESGDVEGLTKALSTNDSEARAHAIAALGQLDALTPLIGALNDAEGPNRAIAAHWIGKVETDSHNSTATQALAGLLQDDYVTARYNAADALMLIGDSRALSPLKEAYSQEREPAVRRALERAIRASQ
jgi:HEAT repeat protein